MKVLQVLAVALALILVASWSQSAAGRLTFLGNKTNLFIVIVVLTSLRSRPGVGGLTGFFAGLFEGGTAGANMTAYCVSRTVVGFFTSFISKTGLQINSWSCGAICSGATIIAQVFLLFLAPPPDIGRFLGATLGTAIYNGVVAGLIDAFLRRTLEKQVD